MSKSIVKELTRLGNTDHTGLLNPIDRPLSYGTAGFRCLATDLPFVVFRVGALAGLRARQLGQCIGVMITASHNPMLDNGVKVVDPMGEMLVEDWEVHATEFVNAKDDEVAAVIEKLEHLVKEGQLNASETPQGKVFCAFDTRDSSQYLHDAAKKGCEFVGTEFVSLGLLTTPQLHYSVRCENDPTFGMAGELGYYESLSNAFNALNKNIDAPNYDKMLVLDCANGVGASKFRKLLGRIDSELLEVEFTNETGSLNYKCGADFVKILRSFPEGLDAAMGVRCASFDGDADRLVYFYRDTNGFCRLLDGDKIAALIAGFIQSEVDAAGLTGQFKIGAVQTAYANGNSTAYIRDVMKIPVDCVPTGVKHLHHAAIKLDIGIYFEANGHGTVVFSQLFKDAISQGDQDNVHLKKLQLFTKLINETVGDAMSDLLVVETILRNNNWSVEDWDAIYEDAPSCQLKVEVKDRTVVKTTWDETECTHPAGLQKEMEELIIANGAGRAFVRPSGTEDVVRVYTEGTCEENAKVLANAVAHLVQKYCA
uniref:Phosphoacetylglucosamine mutase n=1 Tax=Plectus sambesii TaxID=2011161 RepID=A0A914XB13_9BILA